MCHLSKCKSYKYFCFMFCFVHQMMEYFTVRRSEGYALCSGLYSQDFDYFDLIIFPELYFSWSRVLFNMEFSLIISWREHPDEVPCERIIGFCQLLHQREVILSCLDWKQTLNHFKNENQNQNLLPGVETNTALINNITIPWNWNDEQNFLACVVRSTLSPPAAKKMFG